VLDFYAQLRIDGRRDGKPLSATSVETTHLCLHAALEYARESGYIATNPADVGKARPKRNKPELNVWTAEQLSTWLDSVEGHRLAPLFLLIATTGMRRGEACGLKWSDIDLDTGRVSVQRSRTTVGYRVVEGTTKSDKARVVTLSPRTVEVLKTWKADQAQERLLAGEARVTNDYVFSDVTGAPVHPQHVTDSFDAAVRRSGLPKVRLHDLRHGWAAIALRSGTNVKAVQARLGHASASFTLDVYASVIDEDDAAATATFAAAVFGAGS
jgi:integrase